MNFSSFTSNKFYLLSWLILPTSLVYISVVYLLGMINWTSSLDQTQIRPSENLVSAMLPGMPVIEPIVWDGGPLVTFWFDDAWETQFTEGMKILDDRGYKGALAVPSGLLEFDGYMTWPQVRQMQYRGWEITAHTRQHRCEVEKYNSQEFVTQELEEVLDDFALHGITASHFVTPCGIEHENITVSAKRNYESLRGTQVGINPLPVTNPYNLRVREVNNTTTREEVEAWITEADEQNAWLIFMFHQIEDDPDEFGATRDMLSYIVDEIIQSDMKVVLPSQVINMQVKEEQEYE